MFFFEMRLKLAETDLQKVDVFVLFSDPPKEGGLKINPSIKQRQTLCAHKHADLEAIATIHSHPVRWPARDNCQIQLKKSCAIFALLLTSICLIAEMRKYSLSFKTKMWTLAK